MASCGGFGNPPLRAHAKTDQGAAATAASERDVVVRDSLVEARLFRSRSLLRTLLRGTRHRHRLLVKIRGSAASSVPAAIAQQDHVVGHHFRDPLLLAFFIVVTAGLQAPF